MGTPDLTPYAPPLLLRWERDAPSVRHRPVEGTLVFADVSGFTRLSERLAIAGGKSGAEALTDIISSLFDALLTVAAGRGGDMVKYGGDAALLFFEGDGHAPRACLAALEMQDRLREVGLIRTAAGTVRLRMSVGAHSGSFDLFKVGGRHQELVIAGPATTETVRMEAAADAGQVLLSAETAAALPERCLGGSVAGGRLLVRRPPAPEAPASPRPPDVSGERFVARAVRSHLAGDVEPEHRLATVSFLHLMGIDGALVGAGAAATAERLDATLRVVQDVFDDLEVSFLATDIAPDGTKVMAASGVPLSGDDEERRMLLALRRIVDAGTPLPIRAGADRGHVFAAAVGPSFRRTYTAMGDVTNTAARLMGHAGAGDVLVSHRVLDAVRGTVVEQRPPFAAKGKAEPVVPFAVLDVGTAPGGPASALPFVGRADELARLDAVFVAARSGTGGVLEVVGDLGTGKTRLVSEALGRASDVRAVVARCEPYERVTAFHAVRRLLEQVLDRPLVEVVPDAAPHLVPVLALLGDVLDVVVEEGDETRSLEPRFRRERTAAAVVDLLAALVEGPTVFLVEDVHWLDDASATVLDRLASAVVERPWALLVTRRDEPSPFPPSDAPVRLGPLDEASVATLVNVASGAAPLPPHRRRALVERAGGNPLFLTELLSAPSGEELPSSLEAVAVAQVDRLAPEGRRLLRHAAVLGTTVEVALLADVAGRPDLRGAGEDDVARRVEHLLVPAEAGALRFRHQLVRDAAYGSLPFKQRRILHAAAAAAIERTSGEERAAVLSLHHLHAGSHERCWHHARIAAARATEVHANVEAVELLDRAVLAAQRLPDLPAHELAEVWELLGDRHAVLGEPDRAREALRRARRLVRDHPVPLARLRLKEARLAEHEGRTEALLRSVRRGLQALEGVEGGAAATERANLLALRAWAADHQGRPEVATRWAVRALAEGVTAGNVEAQAYAHLVLEGADIALGRPHDGERARNALETWEAIDDLAHQAVLWNNLGALAYYRGQWIEAVELYERARAVNRRVGNETAAGYASFNIAEILVDQGRIDDAEPLLDEVELLFRSVGHATGTAFVACHRARIALHRGAVTEAVAALRSARATFEHDGQRLLVAEVDGRIAECLVRLGRPAEARALLDRALDDDRHAGGTRVAPMLHRVLAWSRAAEGDLEGSWASLDESLDAARRGASSYDVALGLEAMAALARPGADAGGEGLRIRTELGIVAPPPPPWPAGPGDDGGAGAVVEPEGG